METLRKSITSMEVKELIINTLPQNQLWFVSIVYKDSLGYINHKYAYFNDRWDAENWFTYIKDDYIKDRPFYAWVCNKYCWNNVKELCEYVEEVD